MNETSDVDEVLSVEQAGALLKVPAATVRREARAGRLPGRHVGKEWRFARSALIDWLRGELEATGQPPDRYARSSRRVRPDDLAAEEGNSG